ncbi:hypothetical protein [Gordonia humi]|uniref:Uncharacterized protein n=1 Tax=Gordonia humi TaxID=686429 RepID=A0A840ETD1_9ACTN|nr:hypothetical protein [Gordonia humi]MBB4134821.1 hypothetical protein [Gordonia humi]
MAVSPRQLHDPPSPADACDVVTWLDSTRHTRAATVNARVVVPALLLLLLLLL